MTQQYDLIIIGSGGGTKLRPATALGKKVAVIEKDELGGTCLNKGCIPSKMLIYPADLMRHMQDLERHNIQTNARPEVDFSALMQRVSETIGADSEGIGKGYAKNPNVTLYRGHARFVGPKVVEVNGERLTAQKIYVATGSRPLIPEIEGLKDVPYWTSAQALKAQKQPRKMLIIGGGYIAVELGHFYASMGTETHFFIRSTMLKHLDGEIQNGFVEAFGREHVLHKGASPVAVKYENGTYILTVEDADGNREEHRGDALLVVAGVVPNADDLGLEHTSIETDSRGYIKVNEFLETGEEGVYALGDVIGRYLFRHSVNYEGEYLFQQHYGEEEQEAISYPPVPYAVFTHPQIAGVGAREEDLQKEGKIQGKDYISVRHEYASSAMGMAMQPREGFVKILIEKPSGRILGAHILGEKSSDIIHMLILAMTQKMTVSDMLEMIYIHPALSEVIRNAFRKALVQLAAEGS